MNEWRLLAGLWRPLRARLAWGVALLLLTHLAAVGLLGLSGWFITATGMAALAAAAGGAVMLDIYAPGAGIRLFALTRTVARYGERLVNHDLTLRLLAALRMRVFSRFLPLDMLQLNRLRAADALHRLTADVDALDQAWLGIAAPLIAAAGLCGVALLVLALVQPGLAVAAGGLLLAGGGLALVATRVGRGMNRRLAEQQLVLRTRVVDGVTGLATLKALGATGAYRRALVYEGDALLASQRRLGRFAALLQGAALLPGLLAVWAVLAITAGLVRQGVVSVPVMALLILGMLAVAEVWQTLPRAGLLLERVRISARRIIRSTAAAPVIRAPREPASPPAGHAIALDNITFRYLPHARPVLDAFDLGIAQGECLGLTGTSGSGKTTIAHLILRLLQPEQGRVRLGGVDVAALDPAELRRCVALMPQHPVLFSDTVAGNLRLARPHAGDDELVDILEAVTLGPWLQGLPHGLRTWVGRGGVNLAHGEARRLSLAQVLLRDSPVVILDEPSAGLDQPTIGRLRPLLADYLRQRTALVLTHDPADVPFVGRWLELGQA